MISPTGIDFNTWFYSLTTDFPDDTIPKAADESMWREVCNIVAGSPTFVRAGVPRTNNFETWRDWASRVYQLLG